MFGLSMHDCHVWRLDNHAEAVKFHNACRVKRGRLETDERPILGKERSNMGVRIAADGSVRFRYHNTDVVTWYPEDSFKIEVWTSRSTCEFANRFLPYGTSMLREGRILEHGDKYYPLYDSITIHADGRVEQGCETTCFAIRRIDRRKGKAALARTRYAEYRQWHDIMWPMVQEGRRYHWNVEQDYANCLADEEKWHSLMMSYAGDPETLRKSIYRDAGDVFYDEKVPSLPTDIHWSTLGKWRVSV